MSSCACSTGFSSSITSLPNASMGSTGILDNILSPTLPRAGAPLPPLALEMVGDEGEDGVVAGVVVGLVADDEDREVLRGGEPCDGEPHGVAAGVGERGAAGPGLVVGDDPAHGVRRG